MRAMKLRNPAVDVWKPQTPQQNTELPNHRYVVIGSGPVGMRFVAELLQRDPGANIHLFGNEPFNPYNRVQLSSLLSGEVKRDEIDYWLLSNESKNHKEVPDMLINRKLCFKSGIPPPLSSSFY